MSEARLYVGDALAVLQRFPSTSVQCCVTSPPYWGLRDYGVPGQFGLERTPEEYVKRLVRVFGEVQRVLSEDGTLWLNLGDSYVGAPPGNARPDHSGPAFLGTRDGQKISKTARAKSARLFGTLKPKDLVGMPWRVAFALQADGWWLRSDIVWSKPNPMPESVTDRPTKSHEYVFLFAKSERYYYDATAIAEPLETDPAAHYPERARVTGRGTQDAAAVRGNDRDQSGGFPPRGHKQDGHGRRHAGFNGRWDAAEAAGESPWLRNARTVWEIATQPYAEAHFATFPDELARRCILAGSRPSDTVLDPFGGSGTVPAVATGHGRNSIYVDLNPAYLELARQRIGPLLCTMCTEQTA